MRHLNPLSWLSIALALSIANRQALNPLVTGEAIGVVCGLAAMRGGVRTPAFFTMLKLGGALGAIRLLLSLLVDTPSGSAKLLFALPSWEMGTGVSFGGPYTTARLGLGLASSLDILLVAVIVGLMWQAVPAGQWCDLANTIFGRGGRLLVPLLCLGETVVKFKERSGRRGFGLVDIGYEISDSWRRFSGRSRPSVKNTAIAGGLTVAIVTVLVVVAYLGGVAIKTSDPTENTVWSAWTVAKLVMVAWVAIRLVLPSVGLKPALHRLDLFALLASGVVTVVAYIPIQTGDGVYFFTTPGRWPALPPALCATLLVAAIVWASIDRIMTVSNTKRARRRLPTTAEANHVS